LAGEIVKGYALFLQNNWDTVVTYTVNQLELIVIVMAISLLLWGPVGILISQKRSLAPKVLSVSSVIYCIPSLSMFVLFVTIPGLGIGRRSAVLALVLYAMMPMVRNVYQGLRGVDKNIIEAAKGMGMRRGQIIREIMIPLAMPMIFTGFRLTTVMTAGIATIAVYIGERNLGRFIVNGMARANLVMIVVGGALVCAITVLLDVILAAVERRVVPRGLRLRAGRSR
jgi:osmoprotectant transport system permease protein